MKSQQLKYIIILFAFVLLLSAIWIVPIEFLINFAHDDLFFYLKTAYNFSSGYGSTFDGINPTNGYHPLWFLLIAGIYYLTSLAVHLPSEMLFRLIFCVVILICVGSFHLTVLLLRRFQPNIS